MLKGKLARAVAQSHSSPLTAVLAQDSPMTNLLSAQQRPLTKAGARAGWPRSWENLQPRAPWINEEDEDEAGTRTRQGSPTVNASQGQGLPPQGYSARLPSSATLSHPDRLGTPLGRVWITTQISYPPPNRVQDPQGLLLLCSPVDLN